MNKKTLQIGRPLVEEERFHKWASEMIAPNHLTTEPHVTVAYSRAEVDWDEAIFQPRSDQVTVSDSHMELKIFDENLLVLAFQNISLKKRWVELVENGASWDFADYQPHVTLGKTPVGFDIDKSAPYFGPLVFGPEYRKVAKV